MNHVQQTIDYYNIHAEKFLSSTANIEFGALQQKFAGMLPENGWILDLGCGSGRDSRAFLNAGFKVDAFDGSAAMVKAASEATGLPVEQALFEDYQPRHAYDGIWACSSLLHAPREALPSLIGKYVEALKPGGIFYLSFKLGDFEGMRNGRWFTDLGERDVREIIEAVKRLAIREISITSDVRPNREAERWINVWCVLE